MSKTVITSSGNTLTSKFDKRFGRAEFFCLLDEATGQTSFIANRITSYNVCYTKLLRQEGMKIDEDKKMIDIISDIAEHISIGNGATMSAAAFLRYFLFPNEMHYVQVNKLSGGEKKRLFLMTILMKNPNFLILDEPTNDLDIFTLNVLEA